MPHPELYELLFTEASSIRPAMSNGEILKISNPYLRAFAILVARPNFDGQAMRDLAETVNLPEAGNLGRKVQDEIRASLDTPTAARAKALQKRRRAYLEAIDGLLFVPALAQAAFDLRMAVAKVEAA